MQQCSVFIVGLWLELRFRFASMSMSRSSSGQVCPLTLLARRSQARKVIWSFLIPHFRDQFDSFFLFLTLLFVSVSAS